MKQPFGNQLPLEIVRLTNDEDATRFLRSCGLFEILPKPSTIPKGQGAFLTEKDHPTHWLFAAILEESPHSSKRAYVVIAWPKSQFPETILQQELEKHLSPLGPKDRMTIVEYRNPNVPS